MRFQRRHFFLSFGSYHSYHQSAQVPVDDRNRTTEKMPSVRTHVCLMDRLLCVGRNKKLPGDIMKHAQSNKFSKQVKTQIKFFMPFLIKMNLNCSKSNIFCHLGGLFVWYVLEFSTSMTCNIKILIYVCTNARNQD